MYCIPGIYVHNVPVVFYIVYVRKPLTNEYPYKKHNPAGHEFFMIEIA
jgi:hypothetical protein